MHSIPIDEEPLPETPGGPPGPGGARPPEVEVLGDLRGHVLAGRYVLIELLGSGDLGCVYSGRDQASNQQVVVKVLAAPEQREVVLRIAERARRRLGVRHPCVAAVLAEGNMGGLWYAVMEHAPGKNLYHADGDPRFEGAGLLKLAAELAEGLATLHALGAPHGAITPGNLVWSDAGVKLVDLDVQAHTHLSEGADEAGADVSALAAVLLEVAGVAEAEAPWVAAIARVVRGGSRPSAAEWAGQLRAAEIDALRPRVVDAAAHAEGAIDSAWDQLFENADLPHRPSKGPVTIDTGLHRIEPPPQLAVLSYEVEVDPVVPDLPDVKDDEPAISATSLVEEVEAEPEPDPEPAFVLAQPVASPVTPAAAASAAGTSASAAAPFTASMTAAAPITASTTTPTSRVEPWPSTSPASRNNTQLALGLLVIAALCALIAWRLQAWATAEAPPPVEASPSEAPPPPATAERGSDLSPGTSTLARVAPAEAPAAAAVAGAPAAGDDEPLVIDSEGEALDDEPASPGAPDQLSAADFRKVLLRTNRSQRVRACYERHGPGDVQMVALVGRGGKVLKLRMDDGPLAECLRKVVLRLEFPRAARQAQHNYVFHPPADGEG